MSYMQEVEAELRRRLEEGKPEETVKWVKERVLKSYRNGQRDCPKCSPRPRREAKR